LTAVLLRIISCDGKDMGLKPNIKKSYKKYYIVALFIFPIIAFITAAVFGSVELDGDKTIVPSLIAISFIMVIFYLILLQVLLQQYFFLGSDYISNNKNKKERLAYILKKCEP
jgi:Ca2+/H+ antiporter